MKRAWQPIYLLLVGGLAVQPEPAASAAVTQVFPRASPFMASSHNHSPATRAELTTVAEEDGFCYLKLEVCGAYRGSFQGAGALTLYTMRDTVELALARMQMRYFWSEGQQLAADLFYRLDQAAPRLHAPVTAIAVRSDHGLQRYAIDNRRAPLAVRLAPTGVCANPDPRP